jgi:hypothetical protein
MTEGDAIPRPALIIGLLAILPFPVLLILVWSPPNVISSDRLVAAFLAYASGVTALLGGAHWALAAGPYGKSRIAAEGLIGLAALIAAWLALIMPQYLGLSLLIVALFLLALRNALMAEAQAIAPWFGRLNGYLTAAAIVTATLVLIRLIT